MAMTNDEAARPLIACPICGTLFKARSNKGKLNQRCSRPCSIKARNADKARKDANPLDANAIERFFASVDKSEECWIWRGNKNQRGYGLFHLRDINVSAHRVSWRIVHGDIPEGLYICHRCDNPSCVNPDHLFPGTPLENAQDMVRKGRHAHPNPSKDYRPKYQKNYMRGSEHVHSKLNESLVWDMRIRHVQGERYADIARSIGIRETTCRQAIVGERWAHVPFPDK